MKTKDCFSLQWWKQTCVFQSFAWAHMHEDRGAVGLAWVSLIECMVVLVDAAYKVHLNLFYSFLYSWSWLILISTDLLLCVCVFRLFCMTMMIVLVLKPPGRPDGFPYLRLFLFGNFCDPYIVCTNLKFRVFLPSVFLYSLYPWEKKLLPE